LWRRASPRRRPDALDSLRTLVDELPGDLAKQAFTHSSWVEQRTDSYERLAFLGDVVLSLAISDHIYPRFPSWGAGRLTKLRAQAVSRLACADVARELGVHDRLREHAPDGVGKNADVLVGSDRILASVCEALIGAAYLAFGMDRVVALMAGLDNIRDVIAFPKTSSGADLLTGAPAPLDAQQLRELGVSVQGGP